ncbi:MAG: hypothetical protein HYY20_00890 [Candidatus Tectomicrobia bacterium]|uniref:Uncharacterized protein n=1 Tax=Tectimicrobiota bacterium TaxID=2528274 RepID=A0A932CLL2_UNCTE|nr:hypothetical protein [Candidatus Tectomicrobia bacterium]
MFQGADKQVKSLTGGELDIPILAFLGLSGLGLFQILRGDLAAPAWHVAFWYALGIWVMAQPKRIDSARQGEYAGPGMKRGAQCPASCCGKPVKDRRDKR